MLTKSFLVSALLVFSTLLTALLANCDNSVEFANVPPGDLSISRNIYYMWEGAPVSLTGNASDADGDSISFRWAAEAGTLFPADGVGRDVIWTAPDTIGTYRITLRATDGIDETVKGEDFDVGFKVTTVSLVLSDGVFDETDYAYVVVAATPVQVGMMPLTFGPGVTVVFNSMEGGFRVSSSFAVEGTAENGTKFLSNTFPDESKPWKGITFTGGISSGDIRYASFSRMSAGLLIENGAVVTADNIVIDKATRESIKVDSGGELTLTNSKIWDNGAGIFIVDGRAIVTGTSIRYNGSFAFSMISSDLAGDFHARVRDCVMANNYGVCISLSGYASPVINNCSIFLNGPMGMDGYALALSVPGYVGTEDIDVTGNYWGATEESEIEAQINSGELGVNIDYSGWLTEPPVED